VCVCAGLGMRGEGGPAVKTERREGAPGYEGGGGFLGILKMCGSFIAAFPSKKRCIKIRNSVFRNWPLIPNFFVHLSIIA